MLTLLGALAGLLSAGLPELIGIFKKKQDNAHQLKVMELQSKAAAAGHTFRMEEVSAEADVRETEAIHAEFAKRNASYLWVEALIQSVRPVITYCFFLLYSSVKVAQMLLALRATDDALVSLAAIWHENDAALFATIIGFWFGYRAMKHYRNRA